MISYERFDESAWVFDGLDLRTLLTSKSQTTSISELGGFKIGALTGSDEVFVVTSEEIEDYGLEEDLLYPYVYQGKEIARFKTVDASEYVIYPYTPTDSGEGELIDSKQLKEVHLNIYNYLEDYHTQLSERQDSRRYYAKGDDWYRFLRGGRYEYIPPKKLIFKGIATESTVGLAPENTLFSGANCPGFVPDNENVIEYLWSLLNSTLVSEYLVQVCPAKMQGYTRFNANNLNDIPIIKPEFAKSNEIETGPLLDPLDWSIENLENPTSFEILEHSAEK
jgi:hypothetical protein